VSDETLCGPQWEAIRFLNLKGKEREKLQKLERAIVPQEQCSLEEECNC
jgi:hypothetical protein